MATTRETNRIVMPLSGLALVPIRSFDGLTRLAGRVSPEDRRVLIQVLASRVVDAARHGGFTPIVVTADDTVRGWASDQHTETIAEPIPGGLSQAATAAIRTINGAGPWVVVHADLPVVTAADFAFARVALDRGTVLAPSHDGGTSLVGGTGHLFPFHYGPASFRRHLAAVRGRATVIVRPGFALDLDREQDLAVFRRLGFLG